MKNTALLEVIYDEVGDEVPRPLPFLRKRREGKGLMLSFAGQAHALRRHSLNRLSMQIYELCDGERSIADIFERMCAECTDLPPRTVAQHVVRAIRVLQRKGILATPESG